MNDEIYVTLEKLADLKYDTKDYLIFSRIQIEIAQFCWSNSNHSGGKFKS